MRRMYPANLANLVKMQVFMGRTVVCFCPNVSEFARMYPNVPECIANVCPNVCFGSDAALMIGARMGPDAWHFWLAHPPVVMSSSPLCGLCRAL